MTTKKSVKKEEEIIEAEVVDSNSINNVENYIVLKENFDEITDTVNLIRGLLNDTINNYLKIGFLLSSISEDKLKELGCESIYEFSKQNFNLGVTSTKNFINVYERFGVNTCKCLSSLNYVTSNIQLKEEYKDYSMSQLVELLPVSDADIEKFNPEMTCKEIRSLKKISQLTDFENEFYEEVKTTFLKIWNNVFPKIKFETNNKLKDGIITLDGNGSFAFNLSCLGSKIVITLDSDIKNNSFDIYIETNKINYEYECHNFFVDLEENDYSDLIDDIINFINKDCFNFIYKKLKEKEKISNEKSNQRKIENLILKIKDDYKDKRLSLEELIHGDFFDLYELLKNYAGSYLKEYFDFIYRFKRPHVIFDSDNFKLLDLSIYRLILVTEIDENISLVICNRDVFFSLLGKEIESFNYYDTGTKFNIKKAFEMYPGVLSDYGIEENNNYNSLFSIYLELAKVWGKEQMEKLKKEEFEED